MQSPFIDNLSIVLVEPQNPGNIGMVCRAMANFGVCDLRLVNPCQYLHPEARKFAVAANHLLGEARVFADLPAAIADLHVTVATTRRSGRLRGELLDIAEVPALRQGLPAGGRMGLVFGREDVGLTSDEVALCSHAATIATSAEVGSINLAQAVLLFAHELARQPQALPAAPERDVPEQGALEGLFGQIEAVLTRIAFLNPKKPEGVMNSLRQIHQRAGLDRRELQMLRGMWNQVGWSVRDWQGRKRGDE
ncbi:RNA methyltransferase [Trichloromonas sp.]|uniref:RNA methyltransferase n=1 Tax=Trichloromonas sp. TaxID=3069249 RepID=UPI003D813BD6